MGCGSAKVLQNGTESSASHQAKKGDKSARSRRCTAGLSHYSSPAGTVASHKAHGKASLVRSLAFIRSQLENKEKGRTQHSSRENPYHEVKLQHNKIRPSVSSYECSSARQYPHENFRVRTSVSATSKIRVTLSSDGSMLEIETEKLQADQSPSSGARYVCVRGVDGANDDDYESDGYVCLTEEPGVSGVGNLSRVTRAQIECYNQSRDGSSFSSSDGDIRYGSDQQYSLLSHDSRSRGKGNQHRKQGKKSALKSGRMGPGEAINRGMDVESVGSNIHGTRTLCAVCKNMVGVEHSSKMCSHSLETSEIMGSVEDKRQRGNMVNTVISSRVSASYNDTSHVVSSSNAQASGLAPHVRQTRQVSEESLCVVGSGPATYAISPATCRQHGQDEADNTQHAIRHPGREEAEHAIRHTGREEAEHAIRHPGREEAEHAIRHPGREEAEHAIRHPGREEAEHAIRHPGREEAEHAIRHPGREEAEHAIRHPAREEAEHAIRHPVHRRTPRKHTPHTTPIMEYSNYQNASPQSGTRRRSSMTLVDITPKTLVDITPMTLVDITPMRSDPVTANGYVTEDISTPKSRSSAHHEHSRVKKEMIDGCRTNATKPNPEDARKPSVVQDAARSVTPNTALSSAQHTSVGHDGVGIRHKASDLVEVHESSTHGDVQSGIAADSEAEEGGSSSGVVNSTKKLCQSTLTDGTKRNNQNRSMEEYDIRGSNSNNTTQTDAHARGNGLHSTTDVQTKSPEDHNTISRQTAKSNTNILSSAKKKRSKFWLRKVNSENDKEQGNSNFSNSSGKATTKQGNKLKISNSKCLSFDSAPILDNMAARDDESPSRPKHKPTKNAFIHCANGTGPKSNVTPCYTVRRSYSYDNSNSSEAGSSSSSNKNCAITPVYKYSSHRSDSSDHSITSAYSSDFSSSSRRSSRKNKIIGENTTHQIIQVGLMVSNPLEHAVDYIASTDLEVHSTDFLDAVGEELEQDDERSVGQEEVNGLPERGVTPVEELLLVEPLDGLVGAPQATPDVSVHQDFFNGFDDLCDDDDIT